LAISNAAERLDHISPLKSSGLWLHLMIWATSDVSSLPLIAPMIERLMATDRAFAKVRRQAFSHSDA